jgi:hypothetical protein
VAYEAPAHNEKARPFIDAFAKHFPNNEYAGRIAALRS